MKPTTKVLIQGRSHFSGQLATISTQPCTMKGWVNVNITHCNRVYENVPFQLHEIAQLEERKTEVTDYAN
jgi:hypothetical protein